MSGLEAPVIVYSTPETIRKPDVWDVVAELYEQRQLRRIVFDEFDYMVKKQPDIAALNSCAFPSCYLCWIADANWAHV